MAGRGLIWPGSAWSGKARQGKARVPPWARRRHLGSYRGGGLRPGRARLGLARQGTAVQGKGTFTQEGDNMETTTYKIVGKTPLMMHRGGLADPMDEWAKAIKKVSAKRKKTDDDHAEISRLEFLGSLYRKEIDGKSRYYIPSEALRAMIVNAAKKTKRGIQAKTGIIDLSEPILKDFSGPEKPEARFKAGEYDKRGVVVSRARVMRTRPIFGDWSVTFDVTVDPTTVQQSEILEFLVTGGQVVGLLEYRVERGGPFGRFDVEVVS